MGRKRLIAFTMGDAKMINFIKEGRSRHPSVVFKTIIRQSKVEDLHALWKCYNDTFGNIERIKKLPSRQQRTILFLLIER